jgi:hypothetical protein
MSLALLLAAALATQREAVPVRTFPFSAEGVVETTDPVDAGYDDHFDAYALRLRAGTRYRITATRTGPTSFLMIRLLRPGEDMEFTADIATDRDASLTFGPERSGTFYLRISSILRGRGHPASAPYTITVAALGADALPLAPAPAAIRPASWRIWEGAFTAADPDDAEGRRFHEYRLRLETGRALIVTAGRVPPVTPREERGGVSLFIRGADQPDDNFEPLGAGWESGAGPAATAVRPARTGDYIIRVSGPPSGEAVRYRLSVGE